MRTELNPRYTAQGPIVARVERDADGRERAWDPQGYEVYGYSSDPAIHEIWRENSRQDALYNNHNVKQAWQSFRWWLGASLLGCAVWGYCAWQANFNPVVAIVVPLLVLGGQILGFTLGPGLPERVPAPRGQQSNDRPLVEGAIRVGLKLLLAAWLLALAVGLVMIPWTLFGRGSWPAGVATP